MQDAILKNAVTVATSEQEVAKAVARSAITLSVSRVRQNAKNNIYANVRKISNVQELAEALKYDHIAGVFKDNHRANNNFHSANCVIMDCDNSETDDASKWITPESIRELLPGVEFYTCYSRNHMKEKNGKSPRPKFHIYFILHEEIRHASRIRAIKEELLKLIPDADAGAKDAARFIYGVDKPEILYFDGEKDIISFLNEKYKSSEEDLFTSNDASKQEERQKKHTAKRNESQEVIPEGTRNNKLYSAGIHHILTCEREEEAKKKFWFGDCQKCNPKLPDEECGQIWRSVINSDANKYKKLARELGDKEKFISQAKAENVDEKIIKMVCSAVFEDKTAARVIPERRKKEPIDMSIVLDALNTFGIRVRNNKITQKIEVDGIQPGNSLVIDDFHLLSSTDKKRVAVKTLPGILYPYLQRCNYSVNLPLLKSYIDAIADIYAYNPVEDMLNSQEWDGADRITELYKIMGISENPFYCRLVKKWLMQAVAMALNEEGLRGCEFVLVLQGAQGAGKTEFFRNIAMRPEWFYDGAVIDTRNKDSIIPALSAWICEIGEADATLKYEQAQLKSFITANTSTYRRPYGETYEELPRRTVFGATVNPEQFLKDTTGGSRRWATIRVNKIDSEKMRSLPSDWYAQMWIQAYNLYLENNEGYRLDSQERAFIERENRAASEFLPGELELYDYLDWESDLDKWQYMSASQFLLRTKLSRITAEKIGKAIKKIMQYDKRVKMKRGRLYYLPPFANMDYILTDLEVTPESPVQNNELEERQQPETQNSIIESNLTAGEFGELELMKLSYREIQEIYFTKLTEESRKQTRDFYTYIFFENGIFSFPKFEHFKKACSIYDDNSLRDEDGHISGYVINGVYQAV